MGKEIFVMFRVYSILFIVYHPQKKMSKEQQLKATPDVDSFTPTMEFPSNTAQQLIWTCPVAKVERLM